LFIQQNTVQNIERSKIKKSELTKVRVVSIYVFLSGFVYFEPSFAEIFFVLTIPFLLLSTKFDKRITLITMILFISEALSLFRGNLLGWFDLQYILRYTLIDFYLILLFLIFGSVIKQIKNQELLIYLSMKWWTIAAFINIFACFFAIVTVVTNLRRTSIIN
jgi:hypothetical protein